MELIHSCKGGLLEAPRYEPGTGRLMFSDARGGGVWSLHPGSGAEVVVPHRRGIGGLARHSAGGVVVTGRNVAHKGTRGAGSVLLETSRAGVAAGFNDLTVDAAGRLYVGALAAGSLDSNAAAPGALYLLGTDGAPSLVADDIAIPNGVALSPGGGRLYVCDSGRRVVYSYVVEQATGALLGRQVLLRAERGVPDGLAVSEDGSLWVALAGAGVVERYTPSGRAVDFWRVPDPLVTSLCFGGRSGRDVYITTGATEPSGNAGVYAAEADVPGLADHQAQVRSAP